MSTRTNDSKDDLDDHSKDDPEDDSKNDDPTLLIFAAIVVTYLGFRSKSSTMRSCNTSLVAIPVAIAVYIYLLNDRDIFLKKLQTSLLTPLAMLVSLTASLFKEDVKEFAKETVKKTAKRAVEKTAERAVATDQVIGATDYLTTFGANRVGGWDKTMRSLPTAEFEQVAAIRASQGIARGPQAYLWRITSDLDGPYWQLDLPSDLSAGLVGKYQLGRLVERLGRAVPWAVAINAIYQTYKGIDREKFAAVSAFWSTYAIAQSAHENRETCRQSFKCSDDQTWSDCTARVDRNDENFERCQKFFEDDLNRNAIEDRALIRAKINDGYEKALELYSPIIVAGGVALTNLALPGLAVLTGPAGAVGLIVSLLAQTYLNFALGEMLRKGLTKLPFLTGFVGSLSKMYYDASSSSSSPPTPTCKDFSRECEEMRREMPDSSQWQDFNKKCGRQLSLKYHPDKGGDVEKMSALSACRENEELQPVPRKQTVAAEQTVAATASVVYGVTMAAQLIILGYTAPITVVGSGITAALTYVAFDRDEE